MSYYTLNLGGWNAVFAVPCEVVDRHLKLASGDYIKVLLYFLRHAGNDIDCDKVSGALKMPEQQVRDALVYWCGAGLLAMQQQQLLPKEIEVQIHTLPSAQADEEKPRADAVPPRPKPEEVERRLAQSRDVKALLGQAETILCKMLTAAETSELVWYHDCLGLGADVILMLLQYCKEIEKTSLAYITKVAVQWWRDEIDTHQKAQQTITRLKQANRRQSQVRSCFGIAMRSLTSREKKYIDAWFDEFGFDLSVVQKAYETCVDTTGKMSFAYIHSTLKRWYDEKLLTPEQVEADQAAFRETKQKKTVQGKPVESSLDLSSLERFENEYIPNLGAKQ